jgi:hypothetical protein
VSIRIPDEHFEVLEIDTGAGLVRELARLHRRWETSGETRWRGDAPTRGVIDAVAADVSRLAPEEVPPHDDPDARFAWLSGVETLARAAVAAGALAADHEWAAEVRAALREALEGRKESFAAARGWWRFGALARRGDLPPWAWMRPGVETGEVRADLPEAEREPVVAAWIGGELAAADAEAVGEFVTSTEDWKLAYRRALSPWCESTTTLDLPAALRLDPIVEVPLPHLEAGAACRVRSVQDGVSLSWPKRDPVVAKWDENDRASAVAGDEVTGELGLSFERLEADAGAVSYAACAGLARTVRDPDWPAATAVPFAAGVVDALGENTAWRETLGRAARDFDAGETVDGDDLLLVERAIEARAGLDVLIYRYLDPALGNAVAALDARLAGVADAVLAVPGETYLEIIEDADPETGSWWAARLDLDRALPDDLLAEVLAEEDEVDAEVMRFEDFLKKRLPNLTRWQQLQAAAASPDLEARLASWPLFASDSWEAAITLSTGRLEISLIPRKVTKMSYDGCTLRFLGAERALGEGDDAPGVVSIAREDLVLDDEEARDFTVEMPDGTRECLVPVER